MLTEETTKSRRSIKLLTDRERERDAAKAKVYNSKEILTMPLQAK